MTKPLLKIGTRGSPLALVQTAMVEAALQAAHLNLQLERVIIKTSGDWKPEDGEKRLSEVEGGKGLFAREIEKALLAGEIDCAVHSMKDMPSFLPEGLALDHVLNRADPRDAFISRSVSSYTDLPPGAVVGTSSLRRQSFVLHKRPDLKIAPLRGNVATRLAKMDDGQVDATFLALAGLQRLGMQGDYIHPLPTDEMVPACGQGIVAIETRVNDLETRALLDYIHDRPTGLCGAVERAALQVLDGSCHTPIGAYARLDGTTMMFDLVVASGDGTKVYREQDRADIHDTVKAIEFGRVVAGRLKARTPSDIFI
jgi:hydroxymethylbilane synthase